MFAPPSTRAQPPPIRYTERVEVPAPPTPPTPRNFEGELRSLVGDPTSCGDLGGREVVAIQLRATVTDNGVITRAGVSGVPAETAACLRQRLEAARFAGPVERAPRTITATLELRGQRTVTEREEDVTMEFVPRGFDLQRGQQYAGTTEGRMEIQGSNGRPIREAGSQPIEEAGSQPIQGQSGTTIMGPSGVAIGN